MPVGTGTVYVATSVGALATAIAAGLAHLTVSAVPLHVDPRRNLLALAAGSILVVVSSDVEPNTVLSLAERCVRIVVLTLAPRDTEERQYLASGAAAYLPLEIDLRPLANALHALNNGSH